MTGYPLSDFWRVADAETAESTCATCGDRLHIGEVRAGWTRCFLHQPPVVTVDGGATPGSVADVGVRPVDAPPCVPAGPDTNNDDKDRTMTDPDHEPIPQPGSNVCVCGEPIGVHRSDPEPGDDALAFLANAMSDPNVQARLRGANHRHHANCVHNLPADEQITIRGYTREKWERLGLPEPTVITPDDWDAAP